MKTFVCLFLAALVCLPAGARKKENPMKSTGMRYIETHFQEYDALQKRIHGYAELGYLEYKSSKELADHLAANGFQVEMGVAEIPTAFVATFGSGSPVVGLLGEFDALPGMSQDTCAYKCPRVAGAPGHGCGHNLLGTGPCAAAVAISKWLAEGHTGTVKYFGCPAEEGGGGKSYMAKAGCFNGCDVMLDWHPASENSVMLTPGLANVRVNFTFHGKAAHASGAPWNGRSALDAVEAFNYMMNLMREHVRPETRIHYIISNGGKAPNTVPDEAQAVYYLRCAKGSEVLALLERAVKAAEGAAMGTGTTMRYEVVNGNYERLLNHRLSEVYLKNLRLVGGVILDAREKAFCAEVLRNSGKEADLSNFERIPDALAPAQASGTSSDVGNVSQLVPLAKLTVTTNVKDAGVHCWQQTAVGGTTVGTKAALNVARIQYLTALDIFTSPGLVKEIWQEYYSVQGHDFRYVPLMGDRKPPLDYSK
ncbi:MAG: amidohydrolase [Bacteroidales bacterium]|nr:amidohydrolase [Bacteroidales bacterium]